MLKLAVRRLVMTALIVAVVSLALFAFFEADKMAVAAKVLGPYSSSEQRQLWLTRNGYDAPFPERYADWAVNALRGDFGTSIQWRVPVADVLWPRLGNTALLGGLVLAITVPIAFALGIAAGVRAHRPLDRGISVVAVIAAAIPEFAWATLLAAVFVFGLGWLPGTSAMADGLRPEELVLPVAVLVLYGFGYLTRIVRGAMAEAMAAPYVRTARLAGLPARRVVLRHALRNALVAPLTVVLLSLSWLLSGLIVVEVFFSYKGFGKLLLDAALFGDIYVVQACTVIAVAVAVLSQTLSDIGYALLNPRVRLDRDTG